MPKWESWVFDLAMVFPNLYLHLLFEVALAILVEAASAQHCAKYIYLRVRTVQCIFASWPWELLCGLALKSLVGTVWAQQVPKLRS